MRFSVVPGFEFQDHVVLLASVLVIGVFASATRECEQRDGAGKLPVGVINVENAYGSLGICAQGVLCPVVQEIEFRCEAAGRAASKLKQG